MLLITTTTLTIMKRVNEKYCVHISTKLEGQIWANQKFYQAIRCIIKVISIISPYENCATTAYTHNFIYVSSGNGFKLCPSIT